jgi:glycosyltransferase involved in cell wall biosynthesis
VRAVAARRGSSVAGDVPADLPVELVDVEPPGPWEARLGRLRRPLGELGSGSFAARVREAASEADVLHLEETETAWAGEGIGLPSLVHVHFLARRDRDLGAPWRKQFREVLDGSRAERAAARRHRHLVASSPVVADALRAAAPRAEVVLAPLSLDPALYEPAPLGGPPLAGLIGTARWGPTADAMRTLVRDVWPLVARAAPEARLVVAGRGTSELDLPQTTGSSSWARSTRPATFFQRLSLLLFPLARGSGMKVKTLEAMASGVPVVTTRCRRRGDRAVRRRDRARGPGTPRGGGRRAARRRPGAEGARRGGTCGLRAPLLAAARNRAAGRALPKNGVTVPSEVTPDVVPQRRANRAARPVRAA